MPTRNRRAAPRATRSARSAGVVGGGLDGRVVEAAFVGVEAAGGFEAGALAFAQRRRQVAADRVDVQGDVDAARVGQQRVQPGGADLGRVAGDGERGAVAVADPDVSGGDVQGGRLRCPVADRCRRCWCAV